MAKKNLRGIPQSIKTKLNALKGRPIIAACSKIYSAADLARGVLKHLDIQLTDGRLSYPQSIVPPEKSGKYSDKNVNGEEVVRKDLPKETHYNRVETPNWGDSYNGTHTVNLPYEKYPRDFISPRLARIKISVPTSEPNRESYMIVFEVDQVLNQDDQAFDENLLECLNLLQENLGFCGVQASGATTTDYLNTLRVSWEVLPPGTREEALARLFHGKTPSDEERALVQDRYDFLIGLRPQSLIYGTSGLERYFGGLIRNDLVIFENIQYGNAIYIMFEDWQELSKRSRTELLSGRFGKNFERVVHGSGWKGTVKSIIKDHAATPVATR
jgi:hypothetical protein